MTGFWVPKMVPKILQLNQARRCLQSQQTDHRSFIAPLFDMSHSCGLSGAVENSRTGKKRSDTSEAGDCRVVGGELRAERGPRFCRSAQAGRSVVPRLNLAQMVDRVGFLPLRPRPLRGRSMTNTGRLHWLLLPLETAAVSTTASRFSGATSTTRISFFRSLEIVCCAFSAIGWIWFWEGTKTAELRRDRTTSGCAWMGCSGRVWGRIHIGDAARLSSMEGLRATRGQHRMEATELPYGARTYLWPLSGLYILPEPQVASKARGLLPRRPNAAAFAARLDRTLGRSRPK